MTHRTQQMLAGWHYRPAPRVHVHRPRPSRLVTVFVTALLCIAIGTQIAILLVITAGDAPGAVKFVVVR